VEKPRIGIVFHHIGPYHHARLNAAADRFSVIGIEWSAKGHDAWGTADSAARYQKISLFAEATDRHPEKSKLRQAFWSALEETSPEAVAVNGWNNFGSAAAADCCVWRGIPLIVMSESSREDETRTWWKEIVKRRMVSLYSAALAGGRRHIDYLVELGMPRERIFTGYDVVDNDYFARRSGEIRNSRSEIRNKYSLPENYFLGSARFIEKKNLPRLIHAYSEYHRSCKTSGIAPWDLVLLGDGPLRETLNAQLSTLNLHNQVHLPGFKPYDELPVYYAFADAFVHASTTEQWGLVVNEAIASGLPVIVSERCGCVPELVRDNGFTFDPTDEDELASRLLKMTSLSVDERKRFADASRRISEAVAPQRFGEGLERAAQVAMSDAPKNFGMIDRALLLAVRTFGR
jgi:glycosyltransferase involved in cell wall biosynthesis